MTGYHLINILLHVASALLVVAIMRRLRLPGAWLGGAIFALHPVCVESVAWISEQKNTLSGCFYLAAAWLYLGFDESRRTSRYYAAGGLFLLALLAKTVAATLPAALLVVLWWRRGRLEFRRDVAPLLPWFGPAIGAGLVTAWVEKYFIGAQGTGFALDWGQRVQLAGRALWFYAGKIFWPGELVFIYPRWLPDPARWSDFLYPTGAVAVAAACLFWARKNRGPLAALLFFAGTLFPALGFVDVFPFLFSFVADHFQYLASLGLIVPTAAILTQTADRISAPRRWLGPVAGAALVLALGLRTWVQSAVYGDPVTLYRHTLAHNPDCWLAHINLGNLISNDASRQPEAIGHFEAALRLKPDSAEAHCNLANALAKVPGRLDEAIAHYQAALRLAPDMHQAHNNLGIILAELPGQSAAAIVHFEAALRVDPQLAEAHANLGTVLAKDPARLPEAVAEYQAALRLEPEQAATHYYLANALARLPGRLAEAVTEYEAALRLNPRRAEFHANLGTALWKMKGHATEAIAQYEAALLLEPGNAAVHFNLANALAESPEKRLVAVAEYEIALRLQPDLAEAHLNLANLLLKIPGRLDDAIGHYAAAVKLHPEWESTRKLLESLQAARL